MKQSESGFNHIREWLLPKLDTIGISVEAFADMADISRASIYFYLNDQSRPSTQSMARICRVLGVPVEEGLSQYTSKPLGRGDGRRQRP